MTTPIITPFVLGEYQTNCHVVLPARQASRCWIVDVGFDCDPMLDWIDRHELRPEAIVLTHCHVDHIAGVDRALARFGPLPMHVHEAEAGFCSDPMRNLSAMGPRPIAVTEPDHVMRDGDELVLGATRWRVVHVPGHSPGGVLLVHDESRQAIVGDTIFAGSIGRHDFPTSDAAALARSLERVMELPDDTTLFPGHGPTTTVGRERATNPFLRDLAWAR